VYRVNPPSLAGSHHSLMAIVPLVAAWGLVPKGPSLSLEACIEFCVCVCVCEYVCLFLFVCLLLEDRCFCLSLPILGLKTCITIPSLLCFVFVVLEIESRSLHVLDKCSVPELPPQPWAWFYFIYYVFIFGGTRV
jgi:hypothetical protein